MSKLVTEIDGVRIETFDLSQEQHDLVVEMIDQDISTYGNYYLEEVDADTLDIFIDNAKEENNEDYENFLTEAQLHDADVYTLYDSLGDFSQPIGDVAVY
jgi:hypothetical protein